MARSKRHSAIVAATVAGLLLPALAAGAAKAASDERPVTRLARAVTLDATMAHLRTLQLIADVNGGNRAAGTAGYAASAGYIAGQLAAAGYEVDLQPFQFDFWKQNTPGVLVRTEPEPTPYPPEEVGSFTFSPTGDVTAHVQAVDLVLPPPAEPGSTSGCETEDFADFTAGSVALIQRGACTFEQKALNAQNEGAAAVIIFNEGQEGRTATLTGTLGAPGVTIPVVGVSFELGVELAAPGTEVRVATDTTIELGAPTYNVIAETTGGDAEHVVMSGAHLDSVTQGPGINDNGSGSAAQLEVALQFAKEIRNPKNKVRFAWWSAEEFGLLGSAHYVASRSAEELEDIALYLNYDMVASPNFVRFVYDGNDSDAEGAGPGPAGSARIERVFNHFFSARDLPTAGTDFSGRSDYGPFIAVGIPAGGLFTGAEGIKTEEQAEIHGGTAGAAYDACYHQACDTLDNLSTEALDQNADAMAFATAYWAFHILRVGDEPPATADAPSTAGVVELGHHATG
jgi:Zn-dependent M28 family amino/carboxypeptidase